MADDFSRYWLPDSSEVTKPGRLTRCYHGDSETYSIPVCHETKGLANAGAFATDYQAPHVASINGQSNRADAVCGMSSLQTKQVVRPSNVASYWQILLHSVSHL